MDVNIPLSYSCCDCTMDIYKMLQLYACDVFCAAWFIGVVVIMTMSLVLQLLSLVFQVVYLLHGCFLRDQHLALLASAITAFLAGNMLCFCGH